eukprot:PhM_4_TR3648/c0_g1_i1/m.80350
MLEQPLTAPDEGDYDGVNGGHRSHEQQQQQHHQHSHFSDLKNATSSPTTAIAAAGPSLRPLMFFLLAPFFGWFYIVIALVRVMRGRGDTLWGFLHAGELDDIPQHLQEDRVYVTIVAFIFLASSPFGIVASVLSATADRDVSGRASDEADGLFQRRFHLYNLYGCVAITLFLQLWLGWAYLRFRSLVRHRTHTPAPEIELAQYRIHPVRVGGVMYETAAHLYNYCRGPPPRHRWTFFMVLIFTAMQVGSIAAAEVGVEHSSPAWVCSQLFFGGLSFVTYSVAIAITLRYMAHMKMLIRFGALTQIRDDESGVVSTISGRNLAPEVVLQQTTNLANNKVPYINISERCFVAASSPRASPPHGRMTPGAAGIPTTTTLQYPPPSSMLFTSTIASGGLAATATSSTSTTPASDNFEAWLRLRQALVLVITRDVPDAHGGGLLFRAVFLPTCFSAFAIVASFLWYTMFRLVFQRAIYGEVATAVTYMLGANILLSAFLFYISWRIQALFNMHVRSLGKLEFAISSRLMKVVEKKSSEHRFALMREGTANSNNSQQGDEQPHNQNAQKSSTTSFYRGDATEELLCFFKLVSAANTYLQCCPVTVKLCGLSLPAWRWLGLFVLALALNALFILAGSVWGTALDQHWC